MIGFSSLTEIIEQTRSLILTKKIANKPNPNGCLNLECLKKFGKLSFGKNVGA
jgi:hypothetical protein